ncbi:MAG: hypothetical protein GF417_08805 [Candidatus Latescibacteria bacterium]|nr:hypothetical protein [Candidatus Latescibacterota bacterium]
MPIMRTDSGFRLGGYIPPDDIEISIREDSLLLDWPLPGKRFIRVSDEYRVMDIDPFTEVETESMSEELKEEIKTELSSRLEQEQQIRQELMLEAGGDMTSEALNSPELAEIRNRMARTDSENHSYLVELVKTYGWIDPERFGLNASTAAYMIALHSGDLRLMRTAIASLEKYKGKGGPNENMYGTMADRVALNMQMPMSYCLQEYIPREGRMVIPVINDREELNANRERLGLQKFEDYVQMKKDNGFDIRVFEMDKRGFYSPDTTSNTSMEH